MRRVVFLPAKTVVRSLSRAVYCPNILPITMQQHRCMSLVNKFGKTPQSGKVDVDRVEQEKISNELSKVKIVIDRVQQFLLQQSNSADLATIKQNKEMQTDLLDSLQKIHKVLQLDSSCASAYFLRSNCYYFLMQFPQALQDAQTTISLTPDFLYAYLIKAQCLFEMNRVADAFKELNSAVFAFKSEEALLERAKLYQRTKSWELSIKDFETVLKNNQKKNKLIESRSNLGLAYSYFKLSQFDASLQCYLNVLKIIPDSLEALETVAFLYSMKDNYEKSIDYLSRYLEWNSKEAKIYLKRAIIYFTTSKWKECIADCSKTIELTQPNFSLPLAFYFRAQCFVKLNQEAMAKHDSSTFISLVQKLPHMHRDKLSFEFQESQELLAQLSKKKE